MDPRKLKPVYILSQESLLSKIRLIMWLNLSMEEVGDTLIRGFVPGFILVNWFLRCLFRFYRCLKFYPETHVSRLILELDSPNFQGIILSQISRRYYDTR